VHPSLSEDNTASPGSLILFPGDNMDMILTNRTETTENNILITKELKMAIPASEWLVNGVQNGNSTYGTLVQQSTGYALYTAPSSGSYYGPITISAMVNEPDGSQETSLAPTVYVLPKKLRFEFSITIGSICKYNIPHIVNAQGMEFTFHLDRSGQDGATGTIDEAPTRVAPQAGENPQHGETCEPTWVLSNLDFGSDMEMQDPQCTYSGSDNMLRFQIQEKDQDFPGYEMKLEGSDVADYKVPVIPCHMGTMSPAASISSLPYKSPIATSSVTVGTIRKSQYNVQVLQ
jgi:hypothetical protein